MGIVNVTPDSFFPGGRSESTAEASALGVAHFAAGADIVDVGGESTRPGAEPVSLDDELERVIPVVRFLSTHGPVSIDTYKPEVARAAVAAGATVINDISGELAEVAGELSVGYIGMHRQGDSRTMQDNPHYADVVAEVSTRLQSIATRARRSGVDRLWLDPGIGFGKTAEHNLELLAHLDHIRSICEEFGAGLLIGTSRKRFLGTLGPREIPVEERLEGSIATEAWSLMMGADMIRVHDVAPAVQLRELLTMSYEEVAS
jgi:dihydropteroate synthase